MGSYVRKSLFSDERIEYETRYHWILFFSRWPILAMIVLLGACYFTFFAGGGMIWVAIGLAVFIVAMMYPIVLYLTSEFAITSMRVIIKIGLIARKTFEMNLDKIEHIEVIQSILGRMLNYGTIRIRGTGGGAEVFTSIPNPLTFRRKFLEITHQ